MVDEKKVTEAKKEKYEITWDQGLDIEDCQTVRDLKCGLLGKLRSFKGTITRTTEVRPELIKGVFRCRECGALSAPIIQQFKYTQPKRCTTVNCDKSSWELEKSKSEFADFQKIRVQEEPTNIPPGAMPRSIEVILRNDTCERGQAGDVCNFVGYLCVAPDISSMLKPGEKTQVSTRLADGRNNAFEMEGVSGIKGVRELNYKLLFISGNVTVQNCQFNQELF